MNIKTTSFNGAFIIKPKVHIDERGFFMESFSQREIEKVLGRKIAFCQDNQTISKKGVLSIKTIALGIFLVILLSLDPFPPAKITACRFLCMNLKF